MHKIAVGIRLTPPQQAVLDMIRKQPFVAPYGGPINNGPRIKTLNSLVNLGLVQKTISDDRMNAIWTAV